MSTRRAPKNGFESQSEWIKMAIKKDDRVTEKSVLRHGIIKNSPNYLARQHELENSLLNFWTAGKKMCCVMCRRMAPEGRKTKQTHHTRFQDPTSQAVEFL
jgi:hypothetical protein